MKQKLNGAALTLLVLVFCSSLAAQDSTVIKHRVYLGLSFSSYYSKTFAPVSPYPIKNYSQKTLMPLRFGVDVKIRLNPNLSLSTGLLLEENRYTTDYWSAGYVYPGDVVSVHQLGKNFYAALPIRVDLRLTDGIIAPFVTSGLITGVFYESSYHTEALYGDGHSTTTSQTYRPQQFDDGQVMVNLQLGIGLDVNLGPLKIQLFPLYEGGADLSYLRIYNKVFYQHRIGGMLSVSYRL